MSNKTNLRPGDRVRVITYSYRDKDGEFHNTLGDTLYEVRKIDGGDSYRCFISEVRESDGKLYAPQRFDTSLLERVRK